MKKGKYRVLVADDEPKYVYITQLNLEARGYEVLVARDGMEAVQVAMAHTGPIHLMVTDVIMPGVAGPRAADEIRATRPAMAVLYVSGYADHAIPGHAGPGTAAFLEKPFASESLLRKVREILTWGG